MKKFEQGFIDPYSLGFIVIFIGSLLGGILDSGENQPPNTQHPATSSTQESDHATRK